MTTIPPAYDVVDLPDDDQPSFTAAWKRTAHISAGKVLHGYCGMPECPYTLPEGRVLTCGLPECERWFHEQPQAFHDHFWPLYNAGPDDSEEDEEEDAATPVSVTYVVNGLTLAVYAVAAGAFGGVLVLAMQAFGRWVVR